MIKKTSSSIPRLTFVIEAEGWKKIPRLRAKLQLAAQAVYAHLPGKLQIPFSATVLLTGNVAVRRLNRDFRGIDQPTNVLSFPQYDAVQLPKIGKFHEVIETGDIALAYSYTAKEAKENNKLLINHTIHLVIHGLLHLFGYDHMVDQEADKMEKLESKIMQSLNLPDPYMEAPVALPARKSAKQKK